MKKKEEEEKRKKKLNEQMTKMANNKNKFK